MALRPNQPHPLVRKFPRTAGFVVLLVGLVFFYISIAQPILHAHVGEVIKLSGKGGVGGGFFIILGLLLMLFGPRLIAFSQTSAANSQKLTLTLGGLLGVVGIVAMELTKSYLRGKGYILP